MQGFHPNAKLLMKGLNKLSWKGNPLWVPRHQRLHLRQKSHLNQWQRRSLKINPVKGKKITSSWLFRTAYFQQIKRIRVVKFTLMKMKSLLQMNFTMTTFYTMQTNWFPITVFKMDFIIKQIFWKFQYHKIQGNSRNLKKVLHSKGWLNPAVQKIMKLLMFLFLKLQEGKCWSKMMSLSLEVSKTWRSLMIKHLLK